MRTGFIPLFLLLILSLVSCYPDPKPLPMPMSPEVYACRKYLATCEYLITSTVNHEQYQTDNYTFDKFGNLIMNKYVVVKSTRPDDYMIYEKRLLVGNGQYIIESVPIIPVATPIDSNQNEIPKKEDTKAVQDSNKNVNKNIGGSDISTTKSVKVVDNTTKSFETQIKEIGDFLFKW